MPELKIISQPDFSDYEIPDKRFKLPGCVISSDCPKCNKEIILDFNKDHRYLSYPIPGQIEDLSFWCEDCDEEWEVFYRFHLAVRIEAVVTG